MIFETRKPPSAWRHSLRFVAGAVWGATGALAAFLILGASDLMILVLTVVMMGVVALAAGDGRSLRIQLTDEYLSFCWAAVESATVRWRDIRLLIGPPYLPGTWVMLVLPAGDGWWRARILAMSEDPVPPAERIAFRGELRRRCRAARTPMETVEDL